MYKKEINWSMSMQLEILTLYKKNKSEINLKMTIFKMKVADLLDNDRTKDTWDVLKTFINGGAKYILIDMENLEFVDSLGINMLINTAKLIRSNDGDMALINVPGKIETILQPINIERFMKTFKTTEESIKHFRMI
jgi:anti-anti-sigma factor